MKKQDFINRARGADVRYYKHTIDYGKSILHGGREIGNQAFRNCVDLKNFACKKVDTVGSKAFYGCSNLETVFIDSSKLEIKDQAFYKCSNLYSFKCKNRAIRTIWWSAFEGCTKLSAFPTLGIRTSSDLDLIEVLDRAFYGCTALKSITIDYTGVSEMDLREEAFAECDQLSSFSFVGTKKSNQRMEIAFGEACFKNCINLKEMSGINKFNRINVQAEAFLNSPLDGLVQSR